MDVNASLTPLSPEERAELIRIGRDTIGVALKCAEPPTPRLLTPALRAAFGVFVSVYVRDALRGCVGQIAPQTPLHETVRTVARGAAFDDARFAAIQSSEWPALRIEISRLSVPQPVPAALVIPGTHGLYIIRGTAHGLLLPQVAARYGWTAEQFLAETCHKAGIASDAWRDPSTEIRVFEAEVFGG
jgi:AmmeMemoRadiSam system protein A